jgi:hypothetical protein
MNTRRAKIVKMGRPRKAVALRVARGLRLDPELLGRTDEAVELGYAGVSSFTEAVERALADWLRGFDQSILKLMTRKPAKAATKSR